MFFRGPVCSLAALAFSLSALALSAMPAAAQSFNCQLASKPDEVLICQRPQLAALDEQMSSLYFHLRNRLGGAARYRLDAEQSAWLRQRYGCGRDGGCIRALYGQRIGELSNY
jgi:uncharacterized protein